MATITSLPTKGHDIVDTLRRMADGRLLLNVRGGVATPAALLAKAADEIEYLRGLLLRYQVANYIPEDCDLYAETQRALKSENMK